GGGAAGRGERLAAARCEAKRKALSLGADAGACRGEAEELSEELRRAAEGASARLRAAQEERACHAGRLEALRARHAGAAEQLRRLSEELAGAEARGAELEAEGRRLQSELGAAAAELAGGRDRAQERGRLCERRHRVLQQSLEASSRRRAGWRLGPRPGTRPSRASGATARRRCAPVAGGRMRRWPPATRPGARSWRRPWQSGTSWSGAQLGLARCRGRRCARWARPICARWARSRLPCGSAIGAAPRSAGRARRR
ncbi:unnamed protein product, partial [Prorocentrum cordatum]